MPRLYRVFTKALQRLAKMIGCDFAANLNLLPSSFSYLLFQPSRAPRELVAEKSISRLCSGGPHG